MNNQSIERSTCEMDRQLLASSSSLKTSGNFEPSSGQSSSSSFSNNNNRNNNQVKNPGRNLIQNRRNQRPPPASGNGSNFQQPASRSNNNNKNNSNNGSARGHVTSRFTSGPRKGPNNNASLSKVSAKERFVQANCQFVMKSSLLQDYSSHLKDPDLPIAWDNVEEVIFKNAAEEEVCCPICLSDPVGAKITRCGHIYCWSCVLHYLALSDDNYRPCPICYERVRKNELKTATVIQKVAFKKSHFMTFRLMKIAKGSTVAFPANFELSDDLSSSMGRLARNSDDTLNQVCKYFVSSPNYLENLIVREETELFKQKLEYKAEEMPEVCFVEEALTLLDTRKADLLSLEQLTNELNELLDLERRLSPRSSGQAIEWIYFYLSDDGQPIFPHSLNIRMLKHEFGELKNSPQTFSAKIIEILGTNINEELRRRNAHLRHLPLACEIKIAELEFTSDLLSPATLEHFVGEIAQRQQDRKRKAKKEQKRDRRIDAENHRKVFGVFTHGPAFDFNDSSEFPTWNDFSSSPEQSYPVLSPSPTNLEVTQSTQQSPAVADHQWVTPSSNSFPLPSLSSVSALPSLSTLPAGSSSGSPPKEFQSSFASLLHGNNQQFQSATPSRSKATGSVPRMLEGANQTVTSMDMSMSDFLESCIKRGKPKKNKKANQKAPE